MAVTILDGAVNANDNTPGVRTVAATADGTLWTMFHDETATAGWRFFYSTDDGANWSENTSLKIETANDQGAFDINAVRDIAVVRIDNLNTYSIVGLTTSSTTWVDSGDNSWDEPGDMVVFDKPSSTNFYVAGFTGSTDHVLFVYEYTSAGAYVSSALTNYLASQIDKGSGSIDFHHTGDGHTVASSTPHLYIAGTNQTTNNELEFRKVTYSGGSWTVGTVRELNGSDFGSAANTSCVFDGARAIIAAELGNDVYLYERDAGDTTTTDRTSTFPATTSVGEVRLSHQGTDGFTVWIAETATDDIDYAQFTRSGASWGSLTELDNYASGLTGIGFSVMRTTNANSYTAGVWLVDDGSNFDIDTNALNYNVAPNAPTWLTPADSSAQDETATLPVTWAFDDDDDGDTQSAYAIKRTISAVTTYYNAGAGTWSGTEVKNTSTTEGVTLPATWGADGDEVALYVKTWDAADAEGVYGDALNLTGSVKVNPTITVPADSATITGPTMTVTWTATADEVTAHRIRILTSADAVLYDTGKVTSTAMTTTLSGYNLANGLADIKCELRTWNDQGLESSTDTATLIDVTYTAPLTPVLTVTNVDASGYISVAIADPTPSGTPQISYHDVYVRVASGGTQVGERTVDDDGIRIATGVAEDGTYLDYAAASGVDFEYRVLGVATTGATAYSAWT